MCSVGSGVSVARGVAGAPWASFCSGVSVACRRLGGLRALGDPRALARSRRGRWRRARLGGRRRRLRSRAHNRAGGRGLIGPVHQRGERPDAERSGAQRPGQDEDHQRHRRCPDDERPATRRGHAPEVAEGRDHAEDGPSARGGGGGDDRSRGRLGGDRGHHAVREVTGRADVVGGGEPFQLPGGGHDPGPLAHRHVAVELVGTEAVRPRPALAHHATPSDSRARRRRPRPRWRCVLTVPSGRSVWTAISARESSEKKRRTTTSR